jgi:uncharacterized protein (DUF305 family)
LEITIMKIRPAVTAAITLAALLALAGCASSSGSDMDDMHHDGSSTSASAETADANDADLTFAGMMIEHHTQAVEMSDTLLSKDGIDERVVVLAEDIKAAQQPEIDQLDGWLEDWGTDASDMGGMDHGSGMMTDDDMQALDEATGAEAARLCLEQMIAHHRGAIDMAQDEVDNGQNSDAVAMAQTIIDTQTTEIATMEEILATL